MLTALELLAALVVMVVASDAFANAVEWIGSLFGLTRSAVGAIIAAVGSSLPETMIAVVALVVLRGPQNQAVGIGAVVGAPFMLSTLVFSLIGVIALLRKAKSKTTGYTLAVGPRSAMVGLALFVITFALVVGASFAPTPPVRIAASACVVVVYLVYLVYHLRRRDVASESAPKPLRCLPTAARPPAWLVFLQLAIALVATVFASRWFVTAVSAASSELRLPPLLLSLFLSTIATELPEAMNVIIWMRRDKDELAVNNVLGAMIFQTSIASAIGMLATPWHLGSQAYASCIATAIAVVVVLGTALVRGRLNAVSMAFCGVLYLGYVAFEWVRGAH